MDQFQQWVATHWITVGACGLLLVNLIIAYFSSNRRLICGAVALFCFWGMSIGVVMLARDKDVQFLSLLIDSAAVLFFYRLAERHAVTGERHDWAGLISICYAWLVIFDVQRIIFGNLYPGLYIMISNIVFVTKIIINLAPSIGLLIGNRRILIDVHRH